MARGVSRSTPSVRRVIVMTWFPDRWHPEAKFGTVGCLTVDDRLSVMAWHEDDNQLDQRHRRV
jgi:hypothetical protein